MSTIVFEGDGQIKEYIGDYDDLILQRKVLQEPEKAKPKIEKPKQEKTPLPKSKLTYKERKELDELPQKIGKNERGETVVAYSVKFTDFLLKERRCKNTDGQWPAWMWNLITPISA